MSNEIIGLYVVVICFVITFALLCIYEYFRHKQYVKWDTYISDTQNKLENVGFKFNHSYRLINKTTNAITYIRIFEIKFSPDKNKVMVHAYMVSKSGEIGTWYDDFNYLLDIPERWNIEDCGEWNPGD